MYSKNEPVMAIFDERVGGGVEEMRFRTGPLRNRFRWLKISPGVFFYEKSDRLDHGIPKVYYAVRFFGILDFTEFHFSTFATKKKKPR